MGAARERQGEGLEDVAALLVEGGKVVTDGRESPDPCVGAEGIGDCLLGLGQAHIALGLTVVEGHAQVGDEAQHLLALLAQALDEVVRRGLLDAAFAAPWR
jgi:hypothetical protein